MGKVNDFYHSEEISNFSEREFEEFFYKIQSKLNKAKDEGWTELNILVRSVMEPYEDFAAYYALVEISGLRDETEEEAKARKNRKRLSDKAKEMGISVYELETIERLRSMGKI